MKLRTLLFAGLCIAGQAHASLFSDDEAHNQIRQLKERLFTLESADKQQGEVVKQQARLISELQAEIEIHKTELRKLYGQNEVYAHNLQDMEKRQTSLYASHEKELINLGGQHEKLVHDLQDMEKRQATLHVSHSTGLINLGGQYGKLVHDYQEMEKRQATLHGNHEKELLNLNGQYEKLTRNLQDAEKLQIEVNKKQDSFLEQQQIESKTFIAKLEEFEKKQIQQTQTMLEFQGQIEAQNVEFRKLQGMNEDLDHKLQDLNQRQAGGYTDLDTRMRRFDELQKQIQVLNDELNKLRTHGEEVLTHNLRDMEKRQAETNKLQVAALDLQKVVDTQHIELRGQNEELMHNLQELEKKQKSFNNDVSNRLRNVETIAILDLKKKVDAQGDEASQLRDQNDGMIRTMQEVEKRQVEIGKQQTSSVHKLQTQVDALNAELRRLRSQNEDLLHNMQDAEKRQKEFYADMDASLRHFESIVIGTSSASSSPQPAKAVGGGNMPPVSSAGTTASGNAIESGVVAENRAYELAYGYVKAGDHRNAVSAFQEFLKNYPESKHVPRVHYEVGSSYVELKDYRRALDSYRLLLSKYPSSSDVPDAMLGIAESQSQLKAIGGAKNTLNQIIAKYPGTKIAEQAKKRLDSLK